jgi:hypothetical protein
MSSNQGGRGRGGRGGGRGGPPPKPDKAHSMTRLPEGPYVFPVQAPVNAYTGRAQPQVPSLFGGNVDRHESPADTVMRETREESQGHFAVMPQSVQASPTVDAGRYQQHLFTSVVQPAAPPRQGAPQGAEAREMSGQFMPSLSALNHPTPLDSGNVSGRFVQSYMAFAQQQGLQVDQAEVQERMGWHTMQFAQAQLVQDSGLFHAAQANIQQQRDGAMPPPMVSRHTPAYQRSIVDEAYRAMPPPPALPPVQAPPRPAPRSFMEMEIESEAEFNRSSHAGPKGPFGK